MKEFEVAVTVGCFDVFHRGHLDLLEIMEEKARTVVVFLHDDRSIFENKGSFPIQTFEHRRRNLLLTGKVNRVVKVDSADPSEQLGNLLWGYPDKNDVVYIRGNDWLDFPGRKVVEDSETPIFIKEYYVGDSSSARRENAKGLRG